ncbi:serine hydrolase domain-containing protein [Maridesulfovibrio hydrothermalis]|uniref:Beta-lactamase n=1 Tax=Maridesulfovibrio hydrothermalis AM13 = DSM 14728 TaxID=1121451 RepID=L0RFN2_9BACT|nr:serine hydrolase domain-containing protein [Maridesulfovibrio hydrothermalis]CCO24371.1 Beta-lactamase [Maridesulfovibrio hydrothermalis AM13 = DSM 14728]
MRVDKKKSVLIALILFILALPAWAKGSGRDNLRNEFAKAIRALNIPGGIMIVQNPKGERWTVTAGVRKLGGNSPIREELKFRLGSITKTYVASVVLMLVKEGELSLDTKVHAVLPDIVGSDDPVTVRNLLQMRSNLGNFATDKKFLKEFRHKPWKKWSAKALLKFKPDRLKAAGISFEYNNSNYVLLGMIIEKVTKDTFENQVRKRILRPLKLKHTSFPVTMVGMPKPFARGYDYNPVSDKIKDFTFRINPSWAWCSGNAISTAPDVMEWIVAYLDGYGLNEQLRAEQMSFKPALHYGSSYGLGVMNKYGAVGHNGNYAGIYTALAFKFKGYYFVILTNGQSRGGMHNATAEVVFWRIIGKLPLFDAAE